MVEIINGVFLCVENLFNLKGLDKGFLVFEDIGKDIVKFLLEEIYKVFVFRKISW